MVLFILIFLILRTMYRRDRSRLVFFFLWICCGIWSFFVLSQMEWLGPLSWIVWEKNTKVEWGDKIWSNTDRQQEWRESRFDEVLWILKEQYIDQEDIDLAKMNESALRWYVSALWDPYTVYFSAEENEWFIDYIDGEDSLVWVWIRVVKNDTWLLVHEVIKDSPAYKSWMQMLDLVVQVDGEVAADLSLHEAISRIRGEEWTLVELTVYREKTNQVLPIEIERAPLTVSSVSHSMHTVWEIKLWVLSINTVGETTKKDFLEQSNILLQSWIKWLILDLRGNWWWLMDVWIDIASCFLDEWSVIMYAKYKIYPDVTLSANDCTLRGETPVVVLVDEWSASASEIIAAAMKHNGMRIYGRNTLGKWSIQQLLTMKDKSSLKTTIGKWYTPGMENVSWTWLVVDVDIELDMDRFLNEWYDSQLSETLDALADSI